MKQDQWMPIDAIADWEQRVQRMDAFWDRAVLDRPPVWMTVPKPHAKGGAALTLREHWNQPEFVAEQTLLGIDATDYLGDALPVVNPNVGPDIFPVLYGGELQFEDQTSFISHFLTDWAQADRVQLDWNNRYFKALDAIYDAFLALPDRRFYLGWPDLHGGGDCLAAWRGPAELCLDLYDHPAEIQRALTQVTTDLFAVYDYFYRKVRARGHVVTGWPGIASTRQWHVPSNDFSYMIGPEIFEETFLAGLRRECDHFAHSIHHLDGVGCLNHLDAILSIESLDAVQWVYGEGHGKASDWLPVYQKIQNVGKGIQILAEPGDLPALIANLHPEGVMLNLGNVPDQATADWVLEQLRHWR